MRDLYTSASFKLRKDFALEACHNEMEHIKRSKGYYGKLRTKKPCKSLKIGKNLLPLKEGQGDVSMWVTEIPTICCGVCIGKI